MNHVLLMMGGSGTRFGADVPKQFVEVEGRPVFSYVMDKYDRFTKTDSIILVCHSSWVDYASQWAKKLGITKYIDTVAGGNTRSESIKNGLLRLSQIASSDDIVMIHDATHPYLDEAATAEALVATRESGAATLGQKQYDTVYQTDGEGNLEKVIPRETIVSGASPELFKFGLLHDIYENSSKDVLESCTSAGAIALRHGVPMRVIPTDLVNLKITYKHDMQLFQKLFRGYYF